jgi:uncharacterized protein YukE
MTVQLRDRYTGHHADSHEIRLGIWYAAMRSLTKVLGSIHDLYMRASNRNADLTAQADDMALMGTEVAGYMWASLSPIPARSVDTDQHGFSYGNQSRFFTINTKR